MTEQIEDRARAFVASMLREITGCQGMVIRHDRGLVMPWGHSQGQVALDSVPGRIWPVIASEPFRRHVELILGVLGWVEKPYLSSNKRCPPRCFRFSPPDDLDDSWTFAAFMEKE